MTNTINLASIVILIYCSYCKYEENFGMPLKLRVEKLIFDYAIKALGNFTNRILRKIMNHIKSSVKLIDF